MVSFIMPCEYTLLIVLSSLSSQLAVCTHRLFSTSLLTSLWDGSGTEATEEAQRNIPPIIAEETLSGSQEAEVLTTVYAEIPFDTRMMLPSTPPPTPAPVEYANPPPTPAANQAQATSNPTNQPTPNPTNQPVTPPTTNSGVVTPGAPPPPPSTWAPITPQPSDQPVTADPTVSPVSLSLLCVLCLLISYKL